VGVEVLVTWEQRDEIPHVLQSIRNKAEVPIGGILSWDDKDAGVLMWSEDVTALNGKKKTTWEVEGAVSVQNGKLCITGTYSSSYAKIRPPEPPKISVEGPDCPTLPPPKLVGLVAAA